MKEIHANTSLFDAIEEIESEMYKKAAPLE